ncbi:hypothetical protein ACFSL6_20350 [Paenibacillus thailandensis]|uniref:DUF3137 domain-containing protein n=1 Tax=Paenibacillus thailandensis TaxID=393250 RepID=A0ABW5R3G6_9BACL
MVVKEIKANYHSYLNELKATVDPVIIQMRAQLGEPWRKQAWLGPLKDFGGYLKHFKLLQAVQWSALPIIGPVIAGIAAGTYGPWPVWISCCGAALLVPVIYYLLVRSYENKMATIGHSRFHVEAFKAKRPQEFAIWAQFLNKNDFTFEGLYDIVNTVFSQNNHDPSSIAYVVAYSQSQHDFLQNSIVDLQNTIDENESVIELLEDELVKSENAITYLVGIIKKINENLYRYVNGRLDFTDMDFISGFSLYRKGDRSLELIMDRGTSGKYRTLDFEEHAHFAAVVAAQDEMEQAHYHNPYPGRHLVAFRMAMLEGETWVWCFHFDDDDERSLSLLLGDGIIETRQIRRVVHAFCLILQQSGMARKEVDRSADAN